MLLMCSFALAQTPADSLSNNKVLQEVVISNYHVNDSLLNTPAAIGLLSPSEIQRNNLSDITPVLNTLPGIFMQSGSFNTNRITIRGIGARTPYGTNKIRAFYGSIPLTSGDSETTIEDIDIEAISTIEIIKGPLSSLYGAGLGGAIIITPKHSAGPGSRVAVSSTHGSFGLSKNTVNYGLETKGGSLNLNYHKLETDGYRENSSYNREGITLAGDILRKGNNNLTYFGNYTYMKAYIPSSVDKAAFENNPRAAAFTWKAAKGYEEYNSYLGGLSYNWQAARWLENATSVFINAKENYEPRPFDILTQKNIAYGARTQFSGGFSTGSVKFHFIAGMEYFKDGFKGSTFENLYEQNNGKGSLQGERLTQNEQKRSFINAFSQLRVQLSKKIEVQAGLNYNKTQFRLDSSFPPENASSQDYEYKGIWLPQASLLYKLSPIQILYASASRGFSMPAIEETLTPEGRINPDIKPESGYNFEIGGKFYLLKKTLYAEFAVYNMQINNLLVAQRVDDDRYVGVNAGQTLHQGIEALVKYFYLFTAGFSVQPYASASIGNYEFKDFMNNGSDYSGNELTGVPRNKLNAGLLAESSTGLYFSVDYYFTDSIPLNDANSAYADSYNLLNIKAGYRFNPLPQLTAHISAGANNVTNTHYASMVLVNATGFGSATPRYYYPGQPVNYYGNISVSYLF